MIICFNRYCEGVWCPKQAMKWINQTNQLNFSTVLHVISVWAWCCFLYCQRLMTHDNCCFESESWKCTNEGKCIIFYIWHWVLLLIIKYMVKWWYRCNEQESDLTTLAVTSTIHCFQMNLIVCRNPDIIPSALQFLYCYPDIDVGYCKICFVNIGRLQYQLFLGKYRSWRNFL